MFIYQQILNTFRRHPLTVELIFFLFIGALFFVRSLLYLDQDFGWHLKIGQIIIDKGIPITDSFSYTMPSFPFVYHDWLSNILISLVYKCSAQWGLALIYATISLTVLLLFKPKKLTLSFVLVFLLAAAVLLPRLGVRTQVESWLLTAILIRVVSDQKLMTRWLYFIPFFFLLWANLHGTFGFGLAVLSVYLAVKSFTTGK